MSSDYFSPDAILERWETEQYQREVERIEREQNDRMVREMTRQSDSLMLRSARSKEKRYQRIRRANEKLMDKWSREKIHRMLLEQALRERGLL
jgi:hypothetical protein